MACFRLATATVMAGGANVSRSGAVRLLANKSHQEVAFARRHFAQALQSGGGKKPNGTFKLAMLGAVVGAATGSVYTFYTRWTDGNSHKEHEETKPKRVEVIPKGVRITKRYVNPKDTSGLDIVLFQFQTCPFCCKVRAYLDYMGISYSVVEVDAVLRQDIRWSSVKKVPMVLIRQQDGSYVQMVDSSAIISLIATYLQDRRTDIGDLAQFYPHISFFDDDGKKKQDILNKYFLMYREHTPKGVTRETEEYVSSSNMYFIYIISPGCLQNRPQMEDLGRRYPGAPDIAQLLPDYGGISGDLRVVLASG